MRIHIEQGKSFKNASLHTDHYTCTYTCSRVTSLEQVGLAEYWISKAKELWKRAKKSSRPLVENMY